MIVNGEFRRRHKLAAHGTLGIIRLKGRSDGRGRIQTASRSGLKQRESDSGLRPRELVALRNMGLFKL